MGVLLQLSSISRDSGPRGIADRKRADRRSAQRRGSLFRTAGFRYRRAVRSSTRFWLALGRWAQTWDTDDFTPVWIDSLPVLGQCSRCPSCRLIEQVAIEQSLERPVLDASLEILVAVPPQLVESPDLFSNLRPQLTAGNKLLLGEVTVLDVVLPRLLLPRNQNRLTCGRPRASKVGELAT